MNIVDSSCKISVCKYVNQHHIKVKYLITILAPILPFRPTYYKQAKRQLAGQNVILVAYKAKSR